MKACCSKLTKVANLDISKVFVWVDYICIPQASRAVQTLAIHSLPAIASSLHAFVVIAPTTPHNDTNDDCTVDTYKRRGWCRAEGERAERSGSGEGGGGGVVERTKQLISIQFNSIQVLSHCARRGLSNTFIATSLADIENPYFGVARLGELGDAIAMLEPTKKGSESAKDFNEMTLKTMVKVFLGDFSCCRIKHKGSDKCDREELLQPMLGLYCEIYRRRYHPTVAPIYQMIENIKEEVYPKSISVEFEEGRIEERNLFGNYLDIAEKAIDFENMITAASGNHDAAVDLDKDSHDQDSFGQDNDLAPILINEKDLKCEQSFSTRLSEGIYRVSFHIEPWSF